MLRVLLFLLACAGAAAVLPSSKPVLQPASMQMRIQNLLHNPSRSALADVLHGPYPPEARPAYQRAVQVTLIVAACYLIIVRSAIPNWVHAIEDHVMGRCDRMAATKWPNTKTGIDISGFILCSMLLRGFMIVILFNLILILISVLFFAIFSSNVVEKTPELQPACVNQILHTLHLNQV